MPRTNINIPYRSARYFSNKKRTSFPFTHRTVDMRLNDSQQGASCPVNNILVFPKNSETTINVLGNNSQGLPYGNLIKKIKGRKRKDRQRLKKKQNFEGDVKPIVNKVKGSKNKKTQPKMNKHIIFLSDSDNENGEMDNVGNTKNTSVNESVDKMDFHNDEDDDVIFVETPAVEIIEIEDNTEQIETSDIVVENQNKLNENNSPDVNDFLDNAHINVQSKFNFELHGSEFKGAEFLKPSTVAKDMSESGSVSSVSDVSATIGMNVFNVVDFPQEKVNLFDDSNLEKFRNSITPQRVTKKSKKDSKELSYSESRENQNDNLPTLSDIQIEESSRKQRGRSIIKELVNDRAYVLLSTAQKKLKNKKRKSKDSLSDTLEESQNDNQECNKKKKKKKCKKKDVLENETNELSENSRNDMADNGKNKKRKEHRLETEDGASNYTIAIRADLFEPAESETSTNARKSKKNKRIDPDVAFKEDVDKNEQHEIVSEDTEEKKKKKIKRTRELSEQQSMDSSSNIQENCEEKKKKRTKKNLDISTDLVSEKIESEPQPNLNNVREDIEEKKKKKTRRISDGASEFIGDKRKSELTCDNIDCTETNEDRRKKKNRKSSASSGIVADVINQDSGIQEVSEKKREIMKQNEIEEARLAKKYKTDKQEKEIPENIEERKKRKVKKTVELSTKIELNGNVLHTAISGIQDQNEKEDIVSDDRINIKTENFEKEVEENLSKEIIGKFSTESPTLYGNDGRTESPDIEIDEPNESNKQKNDIVIESVVINSLPLEKNNTDVPKDKEGQTKISEVPETIVENQKLEVHTIQPDHDVEKSRMYQEVKVQSTDTTNESEAEKEIVGRNTQENANNVIFTERFSEVSIGNTFDSPKKRKNESSIFDSNDDTLRPIETKRIKTEPENSQPQVHNEKSLIENTKQIEEGYINEIPKEENENISAPVEKNGCSTELLVTKSIENTAIEETEPEIIQNAENKLEDSKVCEPQIPMDVCSNEGHIDMQITNVFSLNKSIFPQEHDFANDVDLDNFVEKNSSWSANPSRFHSYNGSLFNEVNSGTSLEKPSEISNVESVSSVPAVTSSELQDLESNQNSLPELIQPIISIPNSILETIVVKNEEHNANDTVSSENIKEIFSKVVVKIETESEDMLKTTAEEHTTEEMSSKQKLIPSDCTTETTNEPVKFLNIELPNEIEEIVREKDNLNTVKRLCEFLEEVTDPNDVLKKVSLLKQAFIDKSQNSGRIHEEVQITCDNDDVLSISSEDSSVVCLEDDDVTIVSIDHDITLANCDLEGEKDKNVRKETTNTLVQCSSDSNERINSEVKQNDKIEDVASTSQLVMNSTAICEEPEHIKIGLDKYEVEDIQAHMSSDPKLWKIVSEDIYPVRLPIKGKRCVKCKEMGHLAYNCPNKLNLPKCSLCGMEGHLDFRCPNKICTQCGRRAPMMQPFCDHCKHYRHLTCVLCNNKGHPRNKCPDLWRRYHLTVNHGPLVTTETLRLKTKENLWCSYCAKSGHVETQCNISLRKVKNFQQLDPRIHNYEDVYKMKPTVHDLHSVKPNIDEVPSTAQNFLDDSSSTSSSDDATDDLSQNNSIISLNDTLEEDQSSQNAGGDLEDLPPEFVVIDEIIEEDHCVGFSISNQETHNFFMTSTTETLKEYLKNEFRILESSKFNLKNIDRRFYAYREDDKKPEHKQKFQVKRKTIFYKELNMLLFGKLGMTPAHMEKLKEFVNNTPNSIPPQRRESLCYSYDYIFGNQPHQINSGPLVRRDALGLKSKQRLWCSCCASSGHAEFHCAKYETWRLFRNFQTLDPRIHHYEDIYMTEPINPRYNATEVPHASHTLPNDNDVCSASSIVTSNIVTENPSQNISVVSKNGAEQRLQGSSTDVSGFTGDINNSESNNTDQGYQNFFMTASIDSLKKFLHGELSTINGNKFKIDDLIPRFIAFQKDNELPEDKSKFGARRKAKFYKQLNMLLFGKVQVKSGKVQMAKLNHFMNWKTDSLPIQMRESLWCCYDSIFRIKPHEHVNYMFFLKSLKEKYGNRKYL